MGTLCFIGHEESYLSFIWCDTTLCHLACLCSLLKSLLTLLLSIRLRMLAYNESRLISIV